MAIRRLGALVALAIIVAACSAGPGAGGELKATDWVLDSYDQGGGLAIVPPTLFADAEFDGHQVSGFAGCNTYRALYQAGGRTLLVSQPSTTLAACDPATMTFEQTYLMLLHQARHYGIRNDRLTIYGSLGTPLLVFDAAPRNPLLGKWQVDSYGTTPGTVVAVLPDTRLEVVFGIANVGGFAGCNSFTGTYGTNGAVVRIGPLATTRATCEQAVVDQETAFLAALQGVAFIEWRGATLALTDRSGSILVALVRPWAVPSPSPSPSASPSPGGSASPSPSPSASPSPAPSPSPSPAPSPSPSPAPSSPSPPATSPSASLPLPSASLPATFPPTASCKLSSAGGPVVATIVYPGGWSTVTEPADLACRYFDPQPITVPADPATLRTAVEASVVATPYQDAVTAATDPAKWTVWRKSEVNVRGTPVTCVGATAAVQVGTVPAGTQAYTCLANVQTAGTVALQTLGAAGDAAFEANAAVVALMTMASTFTPPG